MSRADRLYLSITILLFIAVVVGGVMLAVEHGKAQPVEIVLAQPALPVVNGELYSGEIYIGGAVVNPGIYSLKKGDTIEELLFGAGIEPGADLSHIELYISRQSETQSPQKIDLNRAKPWLLEALPGIGKSRAQDIVDYRTENGPFKRIEDLHKVKGIGEGTFAKIKDYITVSD